MKKLFLSIVLAFSSFAALAAGYSTGTITQLTAMSTGALLLTSSATSTGQPGCATTTSVYTIDTTTTAGKTQAALALQAASIGKTVYFFGLNTCAVHSGTETLNYLAVVQ